MTNTQFLNQMAEIMNQYGILYKDSVWQEDLFSFQEDFITLLFEYYKGNKEVSPATMRKFQHIFE